LGRWDPLFRVANLAHQMLLALARVVSTKVVLRPDGRRKEDAQEDNKWDFLFHQSGMIGSGILFPNATCGEALQHFPPTKVNDTFAVSFLTTSANEKSSQSELASHARQVVSKIAKLKVTKSLFDEQAAALKKTNIVYQEAIYDEQLLSSWVPDPAVDTVPPPILDAVVAVEAVKDPGQVVASGPADATVDGEQDRLDPDVDAAKQARYISAFEPQVADLNERSSATSEVVALLNQLEDLDATTQRSVASRWSRR